MKPSIKKKNDKLWLIKKREKAHAMRFFYDYFQWLMLNNFLKSIIKHNILNQERVNMNQESIKYALLSQFRKKKAAIHSLMFLSDSFLRENHYIYAKTRTFIIDKLFVMHVSRVDDSNQAPCFEITFSDYEPVQEALVINEKMVRNEYYRVVSSLKDKYISFSIYMAEVISQNYEFSYVHDDFVHYASSPRFDVEKGCFVDKEGNKCSMDNVQSFIEQLQFIIKNCERVKGLIINDNLLNRISQMLDKYEVSDIKRWMILKAFQDAKKQKAISKITDILSSMELIHQS